MIMMRKLILGTVSVLALGIGGAALDFAADADDVANPAGSMPSTSGTSHHWLNAANLSKDDIRWAQVELHTIGLYNGSLDGVVGPRTKQALLGFQESNGLERTATLDQQTADALIGNTGVGGEGSSTPPKSAGTGFMNNSSGASNFDRGTGQK
jgi:peptidoglycan hydrolase-like protein with peptidoglycan-binding domain